ncbi:MAG: DUF5104 domain-containing protein [Firmicutes bacterium]|nr:DUF5104 domain-containing protein [Bacillota bacterium]
MAKIILSILTFLLMLFPNCTRLQVEYRQRIVNRDLTEANIVRIINADDATALEALMCGNIKQNVLGLRDKIGEFFDAIDSEINTFTLGSKGTYSADRGNGKSIRQSVRQINFETSSGSFAIVSTWETYNSFQPDEMGIRAITIAKVVPPSTVTILYDICATNGVGEWHE